MLLIFKLVGCGKLIEIRKNITGDIGLKDCCNILEEYGLSQEDFKSIKIIANGKDLNNEDMKDFIFKDENDFELNIYIYTNINEMKEKLVKIFNKEKEETEEKEKEDEVDKVLTKEIKIEEPVKNPKLDDEVVNKINQKTIELFKNENFKKLVQIWNSEPDIYKEFFRYINKGDIVGIDIPEEAKDKVFEKEVLELNNLGIEKEESELIKILRLYNGQLNFALRDILSNN